MHKWIIALTVILPTLIEVIDTTVVNVSLSHIRGSLSAGIDESTWAITSYLVSNAIIIPITGWLSRFFGRKNYLLFSIALFTASSFLCGSAWSLQSLVFFRILQGIGGGALQPISQSILLETFPPSQHGMALAIFGVGIMFGPIAGPVLGGWITDNWSWNWIFYINVPIGILSIIMVMLFVTDPHYMQKTKMKVDYWGIGLLAVGLGCMQIVLDKGQQENWFYSPLIVRLSILCVVSLIVFIIHELKVKAPVVNLRLFKDPTFSAGNILMFFAFFSLFGSLVLLPIFLQSLMGYTATLAGLVLAPGGVVTLLALPIVGKLINKISPKYLLAFGLIVNVYAVYLMSLFNIHADFYTVFVPRLIMGLGMAFVFIPLTKLTFLNISKEEMGNAASSYNLLRNLGGSFGIAFMTTMLSRRAQFHQARLIDHLNPYDTAYQYNVHSISGIMQFKGFSGIAQYKASLGAIYRGLLEQASMLSFNDTFLLCSVLLAVTIPLIALIKVTKDNPGSEIMMH